MKESPEKRRNGIQWTLWKQLDLADDVALLAHNYHQMQDKTTLLEQSTAKLGLSVSKGKTKSKKMNTNNINPIMLQKGAFEDISPLHTWTVLSALQEEQMRTSKLE